MNPPAIVICPSCGTSVEIEIDIEISSVICSYGQLIVQLAKQYAEHKCESQTADAPSLVRRRRLG